MDGRRRQLHGNALAFALLFAVSLYRQISLRFLPADPFRTYLLYGCYALLCAVWAVSLWARVSQREMRAFLIAEDALMLAGLTIRFVQDTYLARDIPALRMTGLLLAALLLPMYLCGLYAALCIGEGDGYRIDRRWYALIVPTVLLMPLIMADERLHLFTRLMPGEPQPNLTYHPAVGFYLVFLLILVLVAYRVVLIYRKNALMADRPVLRSTLPLLEVVLLLVFYVPYIVNWLQPNAPLAPPEVIEQYAKIYYIEVLSWEVYIAFGLVPTNTSYRELFEHSTLGLQIRDSDGHTLRSANAAPLDGETWAELSANLVALGSPGMELHLGRRDGAELVWAKDVAELQQTMEELDEVAVELRQEAELLAEELRARDKEARIAAQNQILDTLAGEVATQLALMEELSARSGGQEGIEDRLRRLIWLGTYIKRRCNLRLLELDRGEVELEDLILSLRDLLESVRAMGFTTSLACSAKGRPSARFCIGAFDVVEVLLERCAGMPCSLLAEIRGTEVVLTLSGSRPEGPLTCMDVPHGLEVGECVTGDICRVTIREAV